MKEILDLFEPDGIDHFHEIHYLKAPYASAGTALGWKDLLNWEMVKGILASGHDDCWLPHCGRMPEEIHLNQGQLSAQQAIDGFKRGRTLLLRHAEKSNPQLREIAGRFESIYKKPIDIQVYCTPPGQEGFGWHYDLEEVFVIQSSGEKEFYLYENTMKPPPQKIEKIRTQNPERYFHGPEIRCHLKAGDWLYIPSGFWHKAKAKNFSVHFSIGVLHRSSP